MTHDEFIQITIKLNEATCKLRLLAEDVSIPQGGDDGLESILAPNMPSQEVLTPFHEMDAAKVMSAVDLISDLQDYKEMRTRLWMTFV